MFKKAAIGAVVVSCVLAASAMSSEASTNDVLSAAPTSWAIQTVPLSVEESATINGVSCTSSASCLSVGSYTNPAGLVMDVYGSFTGGHWSYDQETTPQASIENVPDGSGLNAISCATKDCLAVGWLGYASNTPTWANAFKWNGSTWVAESGAQQGGATTPSDLLAASCVTNSYCVSVGSTVPADKPLQPLVELLKGTTWSVESTPAQSSTSSFSGISCASSAQCMAVGKVGDDPLTERWNGSTWSVLKTPEPVGSSQGSLQSVSCPSSSRCIAVGGYDTSGGGGSFADVWNGTAWKLDSVENPEEASSAQLTSISCVSTVSCSAVGNYVSSEANGSFGASWQGSSWTLQSIPQPGGGIVPTLQSDSCVRGGSSSKCVAVGDVAQSGVDNALVDDLSGKVWKSEATPEISIPIVSLNGASCSSTSECEAVGDDANSEQGLAQGIATVFDGTSWTLQQTPEPYFQGWYPLASALDGVSCAPETTSCVAAGLGSTLAGGGETPYQPVPWVEQWSGAEPWSGGALETDRTGGLPASSCYAENDCVAVGWISDETPAAVYSLSSGTWTEQTPAVPSGSTTNTFDGVSCLSKSFCIAVGSYVDSSSDTDALAEKWNGKAWSLLTLPETAGMTSSTLSGISCATKDSCLAVGSYTTSGGTTPLAYTFNGTTFKIDAPATPAGATAANLSSVSCSSAGDCLAAGSYATSSATSTALLEAWNATSWSLESVQAPAGAQATAFNGVSCAVGSAGPCVAVGSYTNSVGTEVPLAELGSN
jgi:hypothetical protein